MAVGWLRRRRRRALLARPVPEAWSAWLERHLHTWRHLEDAERKRFLELLKVFVWEKSFVGAGGMVVTDEVKVVIGACAVRLVLHIGIEPYDHLSEIVVYPHLALVDPDDGTRFVGRALHHGAIVLAWPAVLQGLANPRDGHDSATHEFAHSLDLEDGRFDGAPVLRAGEHYRPWAEVLGRHFEALQTTTSPVLRDYGATNPAEFFAVATEAFFERGPALRDQSPDLYAELHRFYGWNPSDPMGGEG